GVARRSSELGVRRSRRCCLTPAPLLDAWDPLASRGVQAANAGADQLSLARAGRGVYRENDTEQPERVGPAPGWLGERCSRPRRRLRSSDCLPPGVVQWLAPDLLSQPGTPTTRVVPCSSPILPIPTSGVGPRSAARPSTPACGASSASRCKWERSAWGPSTCTATARARSATTSTPTPS